MLTLRNLIVLETLFGCFCVEERVEQTTRLHGLLKLALELLLLLSLLKIDNLVHNVDYGLGLGSWAGLCRLIASGWASEFLLLKLRFKFFHSSLQLHILSLEMTHSLDQAQGVVKWY